MVTEPTTQEMKVAWDKFKSERLFCAMARHLDTKFLLNNEGFLWGIFYNGFMAGRGL